MVQGFFLAMSSAFPPFVQLQVTINTIDSFVVPLMRQPSQTLKQLAKALLWSAIVPTAPSTPPGHGSDEAYTE
jgi:hypothetical protein